MMSLIASALHEFFHPDEAENIANYLDFLGARKDCYTCAYTVEVEDDTIKSSTFDPEVQRRIQSLVCTKCWLEIVHLLLQKKNSPFSTTHYSIRRFFNNENCQKMKEKILILENCENFGYNFKYREKIFKICANRKFGKDIVDENCIDLIFSFEKEILSETPSKVLMNDMIEFCEKNISRKKGKRKIKIHF